MNTFAKCACALAVAACFTGIAQAAPIVQDISSGSLQILAHSPMGQSFTAQDSGLNSFGLYFLTYNAHLGYSPLTVTIYDGAGFGGTVLGYTVINPVAGSNGWFDASFNIATTANQIYTAGISTGTAYWGANINWAGNPYAGGTAFYHGAEQSAADFRFRVNAVPEPETYAMLLAGLGLMGMVARRRKQG